jgi:hypothetical protein
MLVAGLRVRRQLQLLFYTLIVPHESLGAKGLQSRSSPLNHMTQKDLGLITSILLEVRSSGVCVTQRRSRAAPRI